MKNCPNMYIAQIKQFSLSHPKLLIGSAVAKGIIEYPALSLTATRIHVTPSKRLQSLKGTLLQNIFILKSSQAPCFLTDPAVQQTPSSLTH